MNVRRNFVTAAPSISRRETPNLRSPPILDEVSPCRPAIIMPQVNNKEDKDAVGNRQCDAEGDGRDLTGRQKADVKGKGEDLKLIESADDMPEFKDDQVTTEEEQVNLDLTEPPPPEVMEYARRELGETDEVKCQMLEEFRDMIYERGECLPHRMDDAFLIRFLRARNFNLKRAHRLIANYYHFKEEHPKIHEQLEPKEMMHIGEDDVITVPHYRTQCGRRMLIYRMGNWNPSKFSIEEIFKATIIVLELGILEPRMQVLGGVVIFDLKDITMTHAWNVTPQVASMMLALMVSSFPIKTYAIHILNESRIFDAMFAVFKPLLDANMRNKLFFHGSNYASLHKHISPECLSKKYGGIKDDIPYYKWIENLTKVPKIVEEMNKVGYTITDELLECFNLK